MVVVALAHPQEVGGEAHPLPGVTPGDLHGPPALFRGPGDGGDPVVVADVLVEVVLLDDLVEVVEDLLPGGDRRATPRLVPVAVGEQVAVGADTGEPVGPPGAAAVVLGLEDDERPVREPLLQVVRGADAGDPGADDEDVDVHRRPGCPPWPARELLRVQSSSWLNLPCREVSVITSARRRFGGEDAAVFECPTTRPVQEGGSPDSCVDPGTRPRACTDGRRVGRGLARCK